MVDRTSRYLRLVHLPVDRTAEAVRDALLAVLAELPETARLTLTWDQGAEMAYHQQIAPLLKDGVFFAHPGRPWQRGTNENTNGLLRQYFPKRTDLSQHTAADLRAVEKCLNNPAPQDPRLAHPGQRLPHRSGTLTIVTVATTARIRPGWIWTTSCLGTLCGPD